jgi:hypothetical protein
MNVDILLNLYLMLHKIQAELNLTLQVYLRFFLKTDGASQKC